MYVTHIFLNPNNKISNTFKSLLVDPLNVLIVDML